MAGAAGFSEQVQRLLDDMPHGTVDIVIREPILPAPLEAEARAFLGHQGRYEFTPVEVGMRYRITVRAPDFATSEPEEFELAVGETRRVDEDPGPQPPVPLRVGAAGGLLGRWFALT